MKIHISAVAGFLLVVIGLFLQFLIGDVRGIWICFPLAALIALSFFLSFYEILFIDIFALFVAQWQPTISFELVVLGALPVCSYLARKVFQLEPWAGNILFTFFGVAGLYALIGVRVLTHNTPLFFLDLVVSLLYSVLVFKAMSSFFSTEEPDFIS